MAGRIGEALNAQSPIAAAMKAGVEAISSQQSILFVKYVRLILPIDGFAFWVRADMVSRSALYNASLYNRAVYNQSPTLSVTTSCFEAKGSLHYSTDVRQDEPSTMGIRRVVFTSEQEIQSLAEIGPTVIYIGQWEGARFAFSNRQSFYRQADLFHYTGDAIYPELESQIIDTPATFNSRAQIVSNSLPLWLSLNGYMSPQQVALQSPDVLASSAIGEFAIGISPIESGASLGGGIGVPIGSFSIGTSAIGGLAPGWLSQPVTLYPSYLVPANLPPPYATVHIPAETTRALQSAPRLGRTMSHHQLAIERVKVTLFGYNNLEVMNFLDTVLEYSVDFDLLGITNMPVPRDEKRTQRELNIIAMKKSIEFDVTYNQEAARRIGRQIIAQAIPTFTATGGAPVPPPSADPIGRFAIGVSSIA